MLYTDYPRPRDCLTLIGYAWGREKKQAERIQDSTGPGRWELNGDKRPLWWHLTPWPGGWCGSWVCQGKDFSRTWSKEQDIHCFSGEIALQTETDRKTETLCFSFHVFVFFLFTSLTVPLLSWCLNLFNTCVYVPTTAWPCCHLAKLHTSRSFHLSLWTSLSSVFNHFGSSFLNSTQFKNKLNCHPCGLKSRPCKALQSASLGWVHVGER